MERADKRRRLRLPLSLRSRLLWSILVPLSVMLFLVGLAATVALHRHLVGALDARLALALQRSSGAVVPEPSLPSTAAVDDPDDLPGAPDFLDAPGHSTRTLGARTIGGHTVEAAVITDRGAYEYLSAAQGARLASVPGDGRPRTVDVGGAIGEYRVAGTTEADGDVILTGLPLAGTDAAVAEFASAEVLGGIVGLLLVGLVGGLVLRNTLRPLAEVAATATRISEVPLASGEVVLPPGVPRPAAATADEVGRVGAALNRLLEHVGRSVSERQAAEMRMRRFLADASHELRTPLTSIRGYAELMLGQRRAGYPPSGEDLGDALNRIDTEAARMSGLVEDLLLLAQLDGGRDLELGDVDLAALVAGAVAEARGAGPDHTWVADLPAGELVVTGDVHRLRRMVGNLLDNIRTHTQAGTEAHVRLARAGDDAVLEVLDDGPGIPPTILPDVSERLVRGDASRSRAAGSTGLGLAIAKSVAQAHGGSMTVQSRPGRTVFTVRLPSAKAGSAPDVGGPSRPAVHEPA